MKTFLKKHERTLAAAILFSFVCFGFMLTHHTITIDEETWILADSPSLLWLFQGRFATQLFNALLTEHGRYAPFLWDFLSVVLWNISGFLFSFCLFGKREIMKEWHLFFFYAYFSTLPFVTGELLSFSMFNLQVCTAMVGAAFAFYLTLQFLEKPAKKTAALILLLLVLSFGVYQCLINVYITAVVAHCLLLFLEKREKLFPVVRTCALFCMGGIAVYYLIHLLLVGMVGSAGYLSDNYVGWFDEGGLFKALFLAFANIARVSLAVPIQDVSIYGGFPIFLVTALFIFYSIRLFLKEKGWKQKAGVLFYTVALVSAPFTLYLVLGTYKTHGRVLQALPLAGAVEIYLILTAFRRERAQKILFLVLSFLMFLNARNMNMLYYYGSIAYEHDRILANEVMFEIQRLGYDYHEKPVVFLGSRPMDDIAIQTSDTIGGSMFAWDDGNMKRMQDFLQTEGYKLRYPADEEVYEALEIREAMPPFPQKGSIQETKGAIVVYFSEPTEKWYVTNNIIPNEK